MQSRLKELLIKEAKDLVDYITSHPNRKLSGASRAFRGLLRGYYDKANKKYNPKDPYAGGRELTASIRVKRAVPQNKDRAKKRFMNTELSGKRHKRRYNPPD